MDAPDKPILLCRIRRLTIAVLALALVFLTTASASLYVVNHPVEASTFIVAEKVAAATEARKAAGAIAWIGTGIAIPICWVLMCGMIDLRERCNRRQINL